MSDEQFPHFQPWLSEENDEISCDVTVDRPMSPPPEEIVEAMEMVEDPPSLPEQRRAISGKHVITCRNCGNPLICFPVRTRYYTCAEVDGQLFKVKQISAKVALNYILKKHTKRAPSKKKIVKC
ncbi:uncharacterized protein LOC119550221 [Drosophila subpulchrella]|uniref:uncharacterized protein LOC119550220 n=1 Tax=Drosophila subpulchrella TaxID=1486046 RepID=UPI0018A160F4|nr:uncharacterized protein LOC119550220 [Drosophila subpulchrella]XP_037714713.1 uncharacterized protein LOC119550221 [Drosophila subpulchrella]